VPTLFERLISHHKNAFIKFSVQYRMNEKISELSSKCVYNGEMKCDEINKNRILKIDINNIKKNKKLKKDDKDSMIDFNIFKDIIDPYKPVVFVEYSKLFNEKELNEANYVNKIEIKLIKEILNMIKLSNFDFNDIGIITPFLKQEKFMVNEFENIGFNNVYTIDKSQGSEKEIIIISFVKTYFNNSIVNDLARINVAFTRAKNKLIILGVKDVLTKFDNIKKYINQMEEMNAIYDLKEKRFI
jgi:DNA replication ATP-dependent helicase Dna2